MSVEECAEGLLSFYETSDADHGPFDHLQRQRGLSAGLEALPVLLDGAMDGGISLSLLEQLKNPILYLVRTLSLEWLTASILKGMIFIFLFVYIIFTF